MAARHGEEGICPACWRLAPHALKDRYLSLKRTERKIARMRARRVNQLHPSAAHAASGAIDRLKAKNWDSLRAAVLESGMPAGLDAFLRDMKFIP